MLFIFTFGIKIYIKSGILKENMWVVGIDLVFFCKNTYLKYHNPFHFCGVLIFQICIFTEKY